MNRLFLPLVLLVAWGAAGSAAAADPLMSSVHEALKEPVRLIEEWEEDKSLSFVVVAGVVALGFVVACINLLPVNIARVGVVVLGSSISLLTTLANTYFEFDHRQYKALASQGRQLLAEANIKTNELGTFPPDDNQARNAKFNEIRRDAQAIIALPTLLKGRPAVPGGSADGRIGLADLLMSTAHAQSSPAPEWVKKPPVDSENFYFVGYADGREYASARDASKQSAYEEARSFLGARLSGDKPAGGADAAGASRFLLDSARLAGSHSYFDKAAGVFRAYTLISLSKKAADLDLRLYAAKNSVAVSRVQQEALQAPVSSGDRYLASRLNQFNVQQQGAQLKMPAAQYDQFVKGRQARFEGRSGEATGQLLEVVRAQPDFYLGWYNLARAYEEDNKPDKAKAAFERAIELDRKGNLNDAALYNTYGFFLFRQKQYKEAVPYLKRALEIAPDHPSAGKTLAAAEAAIGG